MTERKTDEELMKEIRNSLGEIRRLHDEDRKKLLDPNYPTYRKERLRPSFNKADRILNPSLYEDNVVPLKRDGGP